MFHFAKALLVVAACVFAAQAQSDGSSTTSTAPASQSSIPAGLDTCILTCVTAAAGTGGCSSYTDLSCVCTSTAFQQAAAACLQANCTAQDVTTAQQLQSAECAALSSGTSSAASTSASTASGASTASTGTSTGTSTKATSATSTKATSAASSATSSATSTSSSAAMALSAPFSFGTVVGTLVASAGALVGAVLVL